MEAAGGVHHADGAGGAGADGGDGIIEMKAGAGAAGGISKAMRSGNRVGIAAMRLEGRHRDIFKVYIRIEAMEVIGRDDIGIDAESAEHRHIGTESINIGCINYSSKSSLDKSAFTTDDLFPVLEISQALQREGGLGCEGIMHPDESAGARGHPGAYVALVEDLDRCS